MSDPSQVCPQDAQEQLAWDVFFANVVAMQLHPGFRAEPDLARCGYLADRMLMERRKRGGWICR